MGRCGKRWVCDESDGHIGVTVFVIALGPNREAIESASVADETQIKNKTKHKKTKQNTSLSKKCGGIAHTVVEYFTSHTQNQSIHIYNHIISIYIYIVVCSSFHGLVGGADTRAAKLWGRCLLGSHR